MEKNENPLLDEERDFGTPEDPDKAYTDFIDGRVEESKKIEVEPEPGTDLSDIAENYDPANFLVLPGRSDTVHYPTMLVSMDRLLYSPTVQFIAKRKNLKLRGDNNYVGNVSILGTKELLDQLGFTMLTPRQFLDFLRLLRTNPVYDGKGDSVSRRTLDHIFSDLLGTDRPIRGEFLNALYEEKANRTRVKKWGDSKSLQMTYYDRAEGFISLQQWHNNSTSEGLPINGIDKLSSKIQGTRVYYVPPNPRVQSFKIPVFKTGQFPELDFNLPYDTGASHIGVRPAKIKT